MRIISGFFKGKKILEPKDKLTRPLKDLTKESIFNILKHSNKLKIDLEGAVVLDLFSGCGGSFGFQESGFHILLGLDNSEFALKTFERNHNDSKTLCLDPHED